MKVLFFFHRRKLPFHNFLWWKRSKCDKKCLHWFWLSQIILHFTSSKLTFLFSNRNWKSFCQFYKMDKITATTQKIWYFVSRQVKQTRSWDDYPWWYWLFQYFCNFHIYFIKCIIASHNSPCVCSLIIIFIMALHSES